MVLATGGDFFVAIDTLGVTTTEDGARVVRSMSLHARWGIAELLLGVGEGEWQDEEQNPPPSDDEFRLDALEALSGARDVLTTNQSHRYRAAWRKLLGRRSCQRCGVRYVKDHHFCKVCGWPLSGVGDDVLVLPSELGATEQAIARAAATDGYLVPFPPTPYAERSDRPVFDWGAIRPR